MRSIQKITETILLKEKDIYNYNSIKLYDSYIQNFLTKSSLKLCYIFWTSFLFCFYYKMHCIPTISIKNIIFFVIGLLQWFNFSHYFHKKVHESPEQFIGIGVGGILMVMVIITCVHMITIVLLYIHGLQV